MEQKVIMICDDQKKFRKKFSKDHVKHYEIKKVKDASNLIKRVKELKKIPDLILLDLYHPKDGKKVPKDIKKKANDSLKDLRKQIKKTNKAVLNAWDPLGLDILKNLRMEFSPEKLPVVIYTQKGLSLLDDSQISIVDEYDAHWLLKRRGYRYTKIRIDRIIHDEMTLRKVAKIYQLLLAISSMIVGLFLSINPKGTVDWVFVFLTEMSIAFVNFLLDLGIKRILFGKIL